MKKLLLILLSLLFQITLLAQTLIIKDKTAYNNIQGVSLLGKTSGNTLYTNKKGAIDISSLMGEDSIVIKFTGYKEKIYSYQELSLRSTPLLLSDEIYLIDEVVISATKFEEKKEDVPQQTEVISEKEMRFMNQQTTADLLQNSGYALVQKSQGGGGSPIIRGFEANKLLMVVDGVRMNNAIYRGGHLQNILTIDNTVLEKTELIFGAGSVIYGSDALGGVMHFYTKNPILADSGKKIILAGNALSRYGSVNNEKTGHLDFTVGLKKIAFLSSFTYSDFDDLHQGTNRNPFYENFGKDSFYVERINGKDSALVNTNKNIQRGTGYSQYDILEKILFQQNKNTSHILNVQFSTSTTINRYDRLEEISGVNPKYAEWYYGPQKRMLGSYSLNLKRKTIFYDQSRIILAYQDIEESRHDRKFKNNNINHRIEQVKVYSFNADFTKVIKKHELRYGVEANYNAIKSNATVENIQTYTSSPQDTRYPDGGSYMRSLAAYISHSFEITPKWILTEGIRYSNIELSSKFNDTTFFPFPFKSVKQNNQALNGNLGLVYLPGADWRIAVLGSTAFRAPNIDDMSKVFESTGGNVVLPNSSLKPEYTYNAELSLSKLFYKKIKLETTGYYTWYQNAITTGKSSYNGNDSIVYDGVMSRVNTSLNNGEAYIYGISAGALAELNEYLSFRQTLNYTYGRIKTDTIDYPLDHIAPVFGRTSFIFKTKKFKGEFFMLYNGWKRLKDYNINGEDNINYATLNGTPAWYTLNIRSSYQFNQYIALQLAIENILNSNYRVFASGVSAGGRSVSVSLRGRF